MTTVIKQDDLITSIKDALQFISYYHPLDFIAAMNRAYQMEENQAAKDAIAQILINSRMCAEGHRPICQDTGIVNVFMDVGLDVRTCKGTNRSLLRPITINIVSREMSRTQRTPVNLSSSRSRLAS